MTKTQWTPEQIKLYDTIRTYQKIEENPNIVLNDAYEYALATELEEIGLVVSTTHDEGDDTWHVPRLVGA